VTRATFAIEADQHAPWHPGRCAAIYVTGEDGGQVLAGHAGELHPRVLQAFKLPERVCAAELDLSVIGAAVADLPPVQAPVISAYPVATQDVALVVPDSVAAAQVAAALTTGAAADGGGGLLEEVRLFDIYTGEQVADGRKSLAYRLRFRAPDRTLTDEETTAARDAAVAEAGRQVGAVLRGES
jgi:phenylalanyl-tRNA synthetase beta chain